MLCPFKMPTQVSLILNFGLTQHVSETFGSKPGNAVVIFTESSRPQWYKLGDPPSAWGRQDIMEPGLGWEVEIRFQSQLCCQQAVKTSLLLGSLFIYYFYLAYSRTDWRWLSIKTTNVSEFFYKALTQDLKKRYL